MIQLYTKNIDGEYNKVNWNNLKVKPDVKIKEAVNKICNGTHTKLIGVMILRELGLED